MSLFSSPLQQAVYSRLTAFLPSLRIYDDPPNQPDGMPEADFPYTTIGDDTVVPWDTDTSLGANCTITLHVWSRKNGKKEAKTILGQLYTALNREANFLYAPGFRFIDCLHESTEIIEEVDGKTRHGIIRFRITMEKN